MSGVLLHADTGLQSAVTTATNKMTPIDLSVGDAGSGIKSAVLVKNGSDIAADTAKAVQTDNNAETADKQESQDSLTQVADELTQTMSMMKKGLEFKVDELEGLPVVSVVDVNSGELIRQIPSEEALALAEKMSEIAGVLMKTEA